MSNNEIRPNIFIALGIDPEQPWNQAEFERKFKELETLWNRASGGANEQRYKWYRDNKKLFEEIANAFNNSSIPPEKDINLPFFREEAIDIRRKLLSQLDLDIRILGIKGRVFLAELQTLVKQYPVFSETLIKSRLKKLPLHNDSPSETPSEPQLEPSAMEKIEAHLKLYSEIKRNQFENLYDFLGMGPLTDQAQLQQLAAKRLKESFKKSKGPIQTLEKTLYGFCNNYFKSRDTRQKYDNSIQAKNKIKLKSLIDLVAGHTKEIHPNQATELLAIAKKSGINEQEGWAIIQAHAKSKGYALIINDAAVKMLAKQRVCRACGALNEVKLKSCTECGKPLDIECPACHKKIPSTTAQCDKCGFPIGNTTLVENLIKKAETAHLQRDYSDGLDYIQLAHQAWSNNGKNSNSLKDDLSVKIQKVEKRLKQDAAKQSELLSKVETALKNKRFHEAQRVLPQLKRVLPAEQTQLGGYQRQIEQAVQQVEAKLKQLSALSAADLDGRLVLYQEIAAICQDGPAEGFSERLREIERDRLARHKEETELFNQAQIALKQKQFYTLRRLLPKLAKQLPNGSPELTMYRQQIQERIGQAEKRLATARTGKLTERQQLAIYRDVLTICQDCEEGRLAETVRHIEANLAQQEERKDEVLQQFNLAFKQRQFFAAQRLLPELENLVDPQMVSDYRRQISDALGQARRKFTQTGTVSGKNPETVVQICLETLQICADYDEAQILINSTLPSPPRDVQATTHGDIIQLRWQATPCTTAKYVVVRKEATPPKSPRDGQALATIDKTFFDDTTAPVGRPCFYTVFSNRKGVYSTNTASIAKPIMRIQPVKKLIFEVDTQQVRLQWRPPANVQTVVVRRTTQQPAKTVYEGDNIIVTQNRLASDRQVKSNQRYFYTVFCHFKGYGGKIETTSGVSVEIIPQQPPQPISDLEITTKGAINKPSRHLRWSPPDRGEVVMLRNKQPIGLRFGQTVAQEELSKYGDNLSTPKNPFVLPDEFGTAYFCPITIFQGRGYVGKQVEHILSKPSYLTLEYKIIKEKTSIFLKNKIKLHVRKKRGSGDLPAMRLVHNQAHPPRSLADGTAVLSIQPEGKDIDFYYLLDEALVQRGGYVTLFLEDESLYKLVTIEPISDEQRRL